MPEKGRAIPKRKDSPDDSGTQKREPVKRKTYDDIIEENKRILDEAEKQKEKGRTGGQ